MLDRYLLPLQDRVLCRPARWLVGNGITANRITVVGFAIGLLALPAIALHYYWLGLALIVINRVFDGIDGAVARVAGPTDRGAFLDIALDFLFYATVPLAFVVADPVSNGLAGALLLVSFVGTGSSFLAFAVIAEKRGMPSTKMPRKGIFYLGGVTEGTETIGFFIAFCIWPQLFPGLAVAFSVLALITTATRWWWGWIAFD